MTPTITVLAAGLLFVPLTAPASADSWTEYDEIGPTFATYEATWPDLCQRYNLGQSVQGRDLWALRISDNMPLEENEPEFKYISTMHGDEIVGTKMLMMLCEYLLTNYDIDPQATNIIDEIDLWIVPLMNPDGYDRSPRTRYNANGVDLNRNFPNYGEANTTDGREIETAHIMNWSAAQSFTCSANMHAGALVVNYPFDNDDTGSQYSPDDDMFIHVSEQYSQYNLPMWNGEFHHGITNGAAWYMIWGGMQDWNYHFMGNNEVTIELSNNKEPPAYQIPEYWDDNRQSMLAYIETCLIGIRGLVTDADSGAPLAATIVVVDRDHEIYTDPEVGDYHRMLLPGTYDLDFIVDGFPTTYEDVIVFPGDATVLDVQLYGPARMTQPNGGEELPLGEETLVSWTGNPQAQFQVQSTANYGESDLVFDGFESGELGPEYDTGGDADWFVTSAESHAGAYSARAGDIDDNDESWMTRTVGGGEISFWYRVSSEAGYDFFNFSIDGEQFIHASGTNGPWTHFSMVLEPGSHLLTWQYVKDYSQSSQSDTVWIDDLQIVDDLTEWTDIVELTAPGVMEVEWTPVEESEDCKVRVRAYYESSYYGAWDESDDVFAVGEGSSCPADFDGDGDVDTADLLYLLAAWGTPDGDVDGDGDTDTADLLALLASWGQCP